MKRYWLLFAFALLALSAVYLYAARASQAHLGGVTLSLEYATTTAAQELGLGGRSSLAPDSGMLFVFPQDGYYGFWMKDTLIPLDMFWLDDAGKVIWMEQSVATSTYPNAFYPPAPARYVLELNAGFAAAHHIATGTPLRWPNAAR